MEGFLTMSMRNEEWDDDIEVASNDGEELHCQLAENDAAYVKVTFNCD